MILDQLARTSVLAGLIASGALLCGPAARGSDTSPAISRSEPDEPRPGSLADRAVHRGKVTANGISIAFERFGSIECQAVLLIMGNGAQLTAWPPELIEELVKRGYQVIIYDNRDVGLSTKFDSAGIPDLKAIIEARIAGKPAPLPYTLDDMAKDAVGLLDALGVKQAHVVGVSMGGMIAQLVAADHPEHTFSLTSIMSTSGNPAYPVPAKPEVFAKLAAPPVNNDRETVVARAFKMIQALAGPEYPPDEKRFRDLVSRTMKRSDYRAGMARHNAVAAVGSFDDRRTKLRTIKVPAVVIHGSLDPMMPLEGGKDTAANLPGAELRIIPGMGHDLPIPLIKAIADGITSAAVRATGEPVRSRLPSR
jgi:pimeloyl-ACP methyl ester carboxylesterase